MWSIKGQIRKTTCPRGVVPPAKGDKIASDEKSSLTAPPVRLEPSGLIRTPWFDLDKKKRKLFTPHLQITIICRLSCKTKFGYLNFELQACLLVHKKPLP